MPQRLLCQVLQNSFMSIALNARNKLAEKYFYLLLFQLSVFCSLAYVDSLKQDRAEASKMIQKSMLITVASRGHFSVKNCNERKD